MPKGIRAKAWRKMDPRKMRNAKPGERVVSHLCKRVPCGTGNYGGNNNLQSYEVRGVLLFGYMTNIDRGYANPAYRVKLDDGREISVLSVERESYYDLPLEEKMRIREERWEKRRKRMK